MTTQTPDDQPASELAIDMSLMRAARLNDNAKLEPKPALAHPLHIRRLNHGTPVVRPKKPRHESVVCPRCQVLNVLIDRLPMYPAGTQLSCGHRVVLQRGPSLVLDAALFRSAGNYRAFRALRVTLLPRPMGGWPPGPEAEYLDADQDPRRRPMPADHRATSAVPGRTAPDSAQKPVAALPAAISPSPVSGDGDTETPLASPAAQPSQAPTLN